MSNRQLTLSKRFPLAAAVAGMIAFGAAVVVAFSLATADSVAAKSSKRVVLGKANSELTPNCGTNFSRDCLAEGKVTGYQVYRKGAQRKRGFVVPREGKVVSWSISLAKPTKKDIRKGANSYSAQLPFFNDLFGTPASARIAVLKRVKKKEKGPPQYKMVRQSPTQILNPYFGRTVNFALNKPLNVIKNQIVALTIPTWAPAIWKPYSCSISPAGGVNDPVACDRAEQDYTWRASRAKGKCTLGTDPDTGEPNTALKKTRPQQKVDSVKRYGCYYGSNVLLYTATVISK
jgi:hypothetical protein